MQECPALFVADVRLHQGVVIRFHLYLADISYEEVPTTIVNTLSPSDLQIRLCLHQAQPSPAQGPPPSQPRTYQQGPGKS